MSRLNLRGSSAAGFKIFNGLKLAKNIEDLGNAQKTMDTEDATLQVLDPGGGDTDVLLPAEASSEGLVFIFHNNAGAVESLIIKEDSDTTTIATVADGETAVVVCDGTTWYGLVGTNT
jgi:hypothetical protein